MRSLSVNRLLGRELELIRAFGFARLVGSPVLDRRRFGVPVGGAFDRESAALCRALVGLDDSESTWELGMAEGSFRCSAPGTMAVVGAPCLVTVGGQTLAGGSSFRVGPGDEVRVGAASSGVRVYVGYAPSLLAPRRLASSVAGGPLRVVAGPQSGLFDLGSFGDFLGSVGFASDRVGVRVSGSFQAHTWELPSEPACVGAVQVTGSGELVILGPDGPTIGGYPKVAVVIDADLDRVGQLRPGDPVTFEVVSLEQARELSRLRQRRIDEVLLGLRIAM